MHANIRSRNIDRPLSVSRNRSGRVAVWSIAISAIWISSGCQGKRLFSPLASRSTMDGSPPSMHGSSLAKFHQDPNGVRVTSADAVPETGIAPVEQRLATSKSTTKVAAKASTESDPLRVQPVSSPSPDTSSPTSTKTQSASHVTPPAKPEIERTAHKESMFDADTHSAIARSNFEVPAEYEGVDVSALMKALQDAPPEVQKAAVGRLIAMSRQRAQPTKQPRSIENALAASFDSLPTLPDEVIDRGISPTRLAASQSEIRHPRLQAVAHSEKASRPATEAASHEQSALKSKPLELSFTDQDAIQTVAAQRSASDQTQVSQAMMEVPIDSEMPGGPEGNATEPLDSPLSATQRLAADHANALTDAQLFDALVARLQNKVEGESEADRHRRMVMTRHLMVLSGDPDRAVEKIDGLSNEEEEFLRHQLLGLWTIIDPNGHPVPSRRLSSALPEMRKATGYLAAASDSLEVRSLQFCTEIEAYGEVTPFAERRFEPGQEIILYCEVENFVAADLQEGFETRLQGSYDLLDRDGKRVSSQTLPEDRQISKNQLRDYFVAYQMYLPDAIEPGRYQLRLTMEDVHGKKYGQSTIDFEIKR